MYSKITINAREEEIINLLNGYLNRDNNHWYKKDITAYNETSQLDIFNGKTIIKISHPKNRSFAKENTPEGLEFFLSSL